MRLSESVKRLQSTTSRDVVAWTSGASSNSVSLSETASAPGSQAMWRTSSEGGRPRSAKRGGMRFEA